MQSCDRHARVARSGQGADPEHVRAAFNNDVADSWQWADDPRYSWESANLGLRIGANVVVYAMTH